MTTTNKLTKKQIEKEAINVAESILYDHAREFLTSSMYDENTQQKIFEQIRFGLRIEIRRT